MSKNIKNENRAIYYCDDYVKNLYIDMLYMVALYENKTSKHAIEYISSVCSKIGIPNEMNSHMKKVQTARTRWEKCLKSSETA